MPDGWRAMWLMVLYDLPVVEKEERRQATRFHKFLLDQGFTMLHYSVYLRYCGSLEKALAQERRIEKALPSRGSIHVMRMTDRQLQTMRHWYRGRYAGASASTPAQYQLL